MSFYLAAKDTPSGPAPQPRLSATDALLACAAATTRAELHHARLALIESGHGLIADLDTTGLTAGDGTAGRELLGGTGIAWADSTAARSSRIRDRLLTDLADKEGLGR